MKRTIAFLSLFTSVSTLVCCALPALFVVLGFGAAFAGIVGTFPGLIWLSEHKVEVFVVGGVLLAIGGFLQWRTRNEACASDPTDVGTACRTTRDWSMHIYVTSLVLYLLGGFFAFIAPHIL